MSFTAQPDENPGATPLMKQVVFSAINCLVWLIGITVLKWDTFDVDFIFMLDMSLFLIFGVLRILISMDGQTNFFNGFAGRLYFAAMVLCFAGAIIFYVSPINLFSKGLFHYLIFSPNWWTYSLMILNYCGYFAHNFLYSRYYKIANPFVEGSSDFICVVFMGIIISSTLNFITNADHYAVIYAIGLVFARFTSDIFFSVKSRTFLKNTNEKTT